MYLHQYKHKCGKIILKKIPSSALWAPSPSKGEGDIALVSPYEGENSKEGGELC